VHELFGAIERLFEDALHDDPMLGAVIEFLQQEACAGRPRFQLW
jgi:hypothetical protein